MEFDSVLKKLGYIETNIKLDGWHHFAVSVDHDRLTLYIDGAPIVMSEMWDMNFTPPTEPYWEYILPKELFEI